MHTAQLILHAVPRDPRRADANLRLPGGLDELLVDGL
jgi:hypothetical protein